MKPALRERTAWLAGTFILLAAAALPALAGGEACKARGTFVVHEWGTFLSVQGSDGVTLGGMVDSDEPLPGFVEARSIESWQRAIMTQKMETPVTYFYTDRPRDVDVQIEMPKGTLTHWYPRVRVYGPKPTPTQNAAKEKSFILWRKIHLVPDTKPLQKAKGLGEPVVKAVGPKETWQFARQTDAAFVGVRNYIPVDSPFAGSQGHFENDFEKFLFYRGLGTFPLPLSVSSKASAGGGPMVTLRNKDSQALSGIFAVSVEKGAIRLASLGNLAGKATRQINLVEALGPALPLDKGVDGAKSAVKTALVAAGLFPREAQAMVNTWEKSYFKTEGIRLLYVLPRKTVDEVIPIQIRPAPDKLVRVMVGRVEVLSPERERQIEKAVTDLGATEFKVREAATVELDRLGRISEPALRRVVATTHNPEVRARAQALIAKTEAGKQ
jgi:hypothetical protein